MFVLVQLRDSVPIHPSQFGRDQEEVRVRGWVGVEGRVPGPLLCGCLLCARQCLAAAVAVAASACGRFVTDRGCKQRVCVCVIACACERV